MKNIDLKPHGEETVKAVFKDVDGNETTAHGALVFSTSDDSVAVVSANSDGISAVVRSVGPLGTATITATDEQDNASDLVTVTVSAGEATAMSLVDGGAPAPADGIVATDAVTPVTPADAAVNLAPASDVPADPAIDPAVPATPNTAPVDNVPVSDTDPEISQSSPDTSAADEAAPTAA